MLALLFPAAALGATSPGAYTLSRSFVGEEFFSKWDFFSQKDPSGGNVRYVARDEAFTTGLAEASADRVVVRGDARSLLGPDAKRASVRIQSKEVFNGGLFAIRLDHMPTGCGTWPAFWLYGEDQEHIWPTWGEYDVIEGVHTDTSVMTTLHTSANCDQSKLSRSDLVQFWERGTEGNAADSCNVDAPDQFHNQGCSQRGPVNSMGQSFNEGGGGTYAGEWDPVARHIRTWFWPANAEPADLRSGFPEPDSWGAPYSYFSLDPHSCPADHFINMRMVFSLTFCGDLGGPKFAAMCPEPAQTMTCEEFVAQHPEALSEAYWSVRSLDVYQKDQTAGLQQPGSSESTLTFLSDQRRTISPDPRSTDSRFKASWSKVLGLVGMVLALVAVVMVARAEIRGRGAAATAPVGTSVGGSGNNSTGCGSTLSYTGGAGSQDAGHSSYRGWKGMDEDVTGTAKAVYNALLALAVPWRPRSSSWGQPSVAVDTTGPQAQRIASWDGTPCSAQGHPPMTWDFDRGRHDRELAQGLHPPDTIQVLAH